MLSRRGPRPMNDQPPPDDTSGKDEEKWPIGFLLIITLAALYLGWRVIQGIGWLVDKL